MNPLAQDLNPMGVERGMGEVAKQPGEAKASEAIMAFHEQDPTGARARSGPEHAWSQTDLVFDFSDMAAPDAGSMGLVLTARLLVEEQHRRVWVRAMPDPAWRLLDALGLGHLFEFFPNTGGFRN